MEVKTLGIDLGKTVFHVVGLTAESRIALKRRLTRTQLATLTANLPPCLISMEACTGAHYVARRVEAHGHVVRLLRPPYVRPYVKTSKNDFRDAEAIAEAVGRGTMRFVPLQDRGGSSISKPLHRVRERLVGHRTAVVNQIRGFFLDRGLPLRPGRIALRGELRRLLAAEDERIFPRLDRMLRQLSQEWQRIEDEVDQVTHDIEAHAAADPACRRPIAVPGVGPSPRPPWWRRS